MGIFFYFAFVSEFHGKWKKWSTINKVFLFFLGIISQKIKIACLKWDFQSRLIWKCWIQWWYSVVLFWTEKFVSEYQNCLFKFEYVEFGDNAHLYCSVQKIPLLDKFDQKNQNCLFKMKLGAWTNSNVLNQCCFSFVLF